MRLHEDGGAAKTFVQLLYWDQLMRCHAHPRVTCQTENEKKAIRRALLDAIELLK